MKLERLKGKFARRVRKHEREAKPRRERKTRYRIVPYDAGDGWYSLQRKRGRWSSWITVDRMMRLEAAKKLAEHMEKDPLYL